jgi:hypothetical protein
VTGPAATGSASQHPTPTDIPGPASADPEPVTELQFQVVLEVDGESVAEPDRARTELELLFGPQGVEADQPELGMWLTTLPAETAQELYEARWLEITRHYGDGRVVKLTAEMP